MVRRVSWVRGASAADSRQKASEFCREDTVAGTRLSAESRLSSTNSRTSTKDDSTYQRSVGLHQRVRIRDGNGSVGHGSDGSPFLDGSRGSWFTGSDPLTHDDEIAAQ